MEEINIISWNIAGGYTLASKSHWDYEGENLDYFVKNIKEFHPDIICLQEVHINNKRSIAREIREKFKCNYISEVSSHPSHIDNQYNLGLAVLSKFKITSSKIIKLPYPKFKLVFYNGKIAKHFDKHIQIVKIRNLTIINTQFQPLGLWKYKYYEGKGLKYALEIEKVLMKLQNPTILCGDLAMDHPIKVFPILKSKFRMRESFLNMNTRPVNKDIIKKIGKEFIPNETDHILYSNEVELIESHVLHTNTDHLMCYAKFSFKYL